MSKVRVAAFSISLDGFGAGRDQSLADPLGVRGPELMQWFFPTRTFQQMHGNSTGGTTGIDDSFAAKSFENVGAWILGRNMFGPVRGPWPDDEWKGWWGDTPPYRVPVFVLTNHPREPLAMQGGTTFYFVTDGIEHALAQAKKAAAGKDVRIGGGVSTIRQYLQAGMVDEIHLALSPVLLGQGETLFAGTDMRALGFGPPQVTVGENATHYGITKANQP
jgi:dihydrofolate reductase